MPCCTFCSSNQYCSWMERHWCSERPSSSVWVGVEVTVAGGKPVPQGERPVDGVFSLHPSPPTEQVAMAAAEPLGRTGRLSLEPVLLAVSCLGLARMSSEPAARLLGDDPFPLRLVLPLKLCAKFRARAVSCVNPKVQRRRPGCHAALLRKRITGF